MAQQLTTAQVKEFLRNSGHTAQDTTIADLIAGVEDFAERITGRTYTQQSYIEYLTGGGWALRPTNRPIISVTEVYDTEAETAEDSGNYDLEGDGIYWVTEERWDDEPKNRWRVTYVGGEAAPAGLKMAMLQHIMRVYSNRSGLGRQGAAGYGQDFQSLAFGDIMTNYRPYIRGRGFIG